MPSRRRRRRKPSPAKRAADALKYNAGHRRLRADLIAVLIPGTPCPQDFPGGIVCGKPMHAGQELHLGHTRDGSGYLGLVHALCNDRAAQLWRQYRRTGTIRAVPPPKGRRLW